MSHLILFFLALYGFHLNAQQLVRGTSYMAFSLKSKNDVIDFSVTDTNLTVKNRYLQK